MDPLRIAVRAAFAFVFLLAMVRISGKRTIKQGTAFDFVLALIFGDLIDDFVWAEVSASTFITAVGTLFVVSIASEALTWRARIGGR
jgi:uncharacterized membrane protein YcaP (DUF421 family)